MSNTEPIAPAAKRRDLLFVCAAVASLMLGFGIYQSTVYNFAVEQLGLSALQYSGVESIRELPGFLIVLVAAVTMRIAEPKLASISLALIALGMAGYGRVDSFLSFAVYSFIWSVGLHTWMPLLSSMALGLSEEGAHGKTIGITSSVGSIAMLAGFSTVAIVRSGLTYSSWYFLAAGIIAVGAVVVGRARCEGHPEKPRFVLRRGYRLYYALTFLEGCRKQVFLTFAPFVMVKVYGTPFRTIAILMMINSIVNFIGFPQVGRLIDRVGERRILMMSYSLLVPVFLGYAMLRDVRLLYVLYCMDNLLYLSTIGLTTFLNRIAKPEDVMPSLSMGVTMNHTAAVLVPVTGGLIWQALGYKITFMAGAAVVMLSLFVASRIPEKKNKPTEVNNRS